MATISFDQQITVTPDTLINQVGEESVLLNLGSENYFGLDEIGTRMWLALTANATIQQAYESLLKEYDVADDVLRQDLSNLVEKLAANGLIEIKS
ncbi:MAG: PqqD family protein [Acidobacteriota bacterium]|nr:PqqD family protein [Acidobacteriota bacterium]